MIDNNLEFFNATYQGLILLFQFILVITPFIGSKALYDTRRTTRPKLFRFSTKGWFFMSFGLLLIIISFLQIRISEKITKNEKDRVTRNDSIREIRNKNEILDTGFKTNKMLAQYGLKVDVKNNEIVKILKDPKQRTVTNNYGESPVLEITEIILDKKNDSEKLYITFKSFEGASYGINVKMDMLTDIDNKMCFLAKNLPTLTDDSILPKDKLVYILLGLEKNRIEKFKYIYFKLYGYYKKEDGMKIFVEKYYSYDVMHPEQGLGLPTTVTTEFIKSAYQ